ncbi:MAG: RNA-directed DNA polymerase [archaeon]
MGNLTSQFFANLYLNELDYFVKRKLKIKYYIRYVDDFIIFHNSKEKLEFYKEEIGSFLTSKLDIELHPDKSRIFPIHRGTNFLGFKIFPYHRIIKNQNLRRFKGKLKQLEKQYRQGGISYDELYDSLEGWLAYAKNANTYKLRKEILEQVETLFSKEVSSKEINRYQKYN